MYVNSLNSSKFEQDVQLRPARYLLLFPSNISHHSSSSVFNADSKIWDFNRISWFAQQVLFCKTFNVFFLIFLLIVHVYNGVHDFLKLISLYGGMWKKIFIYKQNSRMAIKKKENTFFAVLYYIDGYYYVIHLWWIRWMKKRDYFRMILTATCYILVLLLRSLYSFWLIPVYEWNSSIILFSTINFTLIVIFHACVCGNVGCILFYHCWNNCTLTIFC